MSPARVRAAGLVALFVAALLVGLELARPFAAASVAYDSQVAVIHFDRIVAGRQLEQFVTTTPKPLLTAIYGPLHALTGDWRPLAWAAVLAFAAGVTGVAALVARIAGPGAAAFSGLAVLAAPTLLFDVGFALATPWALVGWVAAGWALTAERPRYGLAGVALLLATLARFETVVVIGVAVLVLVGALPRRTPAPRRAWLTPLIGSAALVVMGIHDWLLSGNPLLWSEVAGRYTQVTTEEVLSVGGVLRFLASRYAETGAMTLLAIAGVARLVAMRQWPIVVGLVALGPGVAAFLVVLAARGVFVSDRYAAAIDIAVAVSAGIGVARLAFDLVPRAAGGSRRLPDGLRRGSGVALAALAAVVITWPHGPLDATVRARVRARLAGDLDADRAVPVIAAAVRSEGATVATLVYAPTPVLPRVAVDLDLPLTRITGVDGLIVDPAGGTPRPGQIVVHDREAETYPDRRAPLEVATPTRLGSLTVDPLLADPARGVWVVAIR
jgi:hypothetical protein